MTLHIDTTRFNHATISLKKDHQIVLEKEVSAGKGLSANLLKEVDSLLNKASIEIRGLNNIEVATKSKDTFTGTRIGISVANALGFVLGVKVNGKEFVVPEY